MKKIYKVLRGTYAEKTLSIRMALFYTLKAYICERIGRIRNTNWEIESIPYYYGKVTYTWDYAQSWAEQSVEVGIFKNWYINVYENGT